MEKINVICIDNQEVFLKILLKDLEQFENEINVYEFTHAEDAFSFMENLYEVSKKNTIGLIISDHMLPMKKGIPFF